MSTHHLLAVNQLSTGYAHQPAALTNVTFTIKPGEIIALLGPNGGGKTTLLRALVNELPAQTGEIRCTEKVSYLAQTHHTRTDLPLSVFDVALMGAYERTPWYRRIQEKDKQLAYANLEKVGLTSLATKQFGDLSGGQRQRALLAKALMQQASLLLLDEPFAGVDHESEQKIMELFAQLRGEGQSLLVATHDISQAKQWDQVLCVNRKQVAFGPPQTALTAETLHQTYGSEIVVLADGQTAIAVQHHDH